MFGITRLLVILRGIWARDAVWPGTYIVADVSEEPPTSWWKPSKLMYQVSPFIIIIIIIIIILIYLNWVVTRWQWLFYM